MHNKALELAKTLFELEGDTIYNDPTFHWLFYNWFNKYGEDSINYKDFSYPEIDVQKLADIIFDDYKNNVLDSLEYNYMMPSMYNGFINKVFEKELASKTKVGFQSTLILN